MPWVRRFMDSRALWEYVSRPMQVSDYSFNLPEHLIAKEPVSPRDSSRLLVVDRASGQLQHSQFKNIVEFLKPTDQLILNDTKVIPARLFGHLPSGGKVELLLLRAFPEGNHVWHCLAKPGRKVRDDAKVDFAEGVTARISAHDANSFRAEFPVALDFFAWLERVGVPPLPPYIKRDSHARDREDYQTVFAKHRGSVAAPTAGLHFTPEVLAALKAKGLGISSVTLHVGYGTFAPIDWANPDAHRMHSERYEVPLETIQALERARAQGFRIVAVGTTSLRTLESIPERGLKGETDLFIRPGFHFRNTDVLITNFHLPESSLFVLVSAFMGRDLAQKAYAEAIKEGYRFYSYGDAMLIL